MKKLKEFHNFLDSTGLNTMNSELDMQERVIEVLKTVFDPEIPVNIYDLGLIYRIELSEDNTALDVDMTLTAPNCPAADFIVEDVRQKLETITGIEKVAVNLVFEPEWDKDMMSEEAKMELGFL
jgi:FeS assembly SUF system protein